ncbi:MAG: saccharopine dehydrogenase NADP-binding domain-containing protein [Deltaproteobacteria bacterium]|nr:saccharopine dehydrogenase NADP-binding domain-containing protein [Deltaproteobacteria bacterium]
MKKRYAVLGAGRQGVAAAYDLAKFGQAQEIILADREPSLAQNQATRLNKLLQKKLVTPTALDVSDTSFLFNLLKPIDGVFSAVPYFLNEKITQMAIETQTHMVDLGGNTDVVWKQHQLSSNAKAAGITIIPDCGLMPGYGNLLAVYALETLDEVHSVHIRCGGLPQQPKPPLQYKLVFSIEGLTNEYFGKAHFLRNGKIIEVDTFTELETLAFQPPVGTCEAFTTSGGTSTCPWSFEGKIQNYDYKTVRYPGHYEKIKTCLELGLLDTTPVTVGDCTLSPRQVFHTVVTPKINFPEDKDLVVLRATCQGIKNGESKTITLETIDFLDDTTGFSAMERTTGFSAALVLEMLVLGNYPTGVHRLETTLSGKTYLEHLQKHSIPVSIRK